MSSLLADARVKVMEEVPYVKKRSSENLRYTFAGEADLIQKLRPSMVKHGISVHCSRVESVASREYSTSKGAVMVELTGHLTFMFTHISGETIETTIVAQASDSGDKAAGKLMTSGMKYALRQFFLIETGDDPDEVVSERYSLNSEAVSAAVRAIVGSKTEDELDVLFQRFLVSERAGFDEAQISRLERAITSQRNAIKSKIQMKKTRP